MKKKIACFFSGGYTELNAMIKFMMKINKDVEYVQLCPRGPRKSATAIKSRELASIDKSMNGKTGESLIRFVLDFIETK